MVCERVDALPSNEAGGAADGLRAEPRPGAVGAAGVERDADHRHVKVGHLFLINEEERLCVCTR